MENKNLGDQGRELLNDIMSGDFSQLNDKVKNFSQSAIDEFNRATVDIQTKAGPAFKESKRQIMDSVNIAKESVLKAKKQARDAYGGAYKKEFKVKSQSQNQTRRQPVEEKKAALPKVVRRHPGTGAIATGSAGLSLFLAASITLGCVWFGTGMRIEVLKLLTIIFGGLAILNIDLIRNGVQKKNFYLRYEAYYNMLAKDGFCEIKAMAGRLGYSRKKVIKDLRKMIRQGLFPEGHFDEKKILFIGNDEIFKQYMDARKGYEERAWEEKLTQREEALKNQKNSEQNAMSQELAKALEEGNSTLEQLRFTRQGIYNEVVSKKIDELEVLITKIFSCVEKHPQKLPEIHKFMEYYLPITMKLVNAYKEFESQPIQGENISKSKKEIEDTLDTITVAFEKLLDSLYEGEAMEVSSDISVLHALFAQEGLTKKDFDI